MNALDQIAAGVRFETQRSPTVAFNRLVEHALFVRSGLRARCDFLANGQNALASLVGPICDKSGIIDTHHWVQSKGLFARQDSLIQHALFFLGFIGQKARTCLHEFSRIFTNEPNAKPRESFVWLRTSSPGIRGNS